jgi:threonyl-tRNA synthetase
LLRVRAFCLSDAHIICKDEEQAVDEIGGALDLIEYVNSIFGLEMGKDYWYVLSMGDRENTEKYYKDDAGWDKAETLLRDAMKKRGASFSEAKDDAAFYGPKIDVNMKNANGKEDTAFTVQYDLSSPHRFDLKYVGEDGKEHSAFVVHRSSIGAMERIMAFLIEKYAGAFPIWLAPVQVKVLPIGEGHIEYAKAVTEKLKAENIRVELDLSNESLGKKVRNAKTEKVPYWLVLGKEVSENKVTLESRDNGQLGQITLDELVLKLAEEIKTRK